MNRNQYLLLEYIKLQRDFINNRNDKFYNYLHNRGITDDIIENYELGYSGTKYFDTKGKRGNVKEPLIGTNAITIPFRDINNGRIIGFQSRFIDKVNINDVEYRYFNSEVIPFVYEKKKYIYNLNNVIKDNNYSKEIYIVEGVFDLWSMILSGIHNVGAVIGNKLTTEIVEILIRYGFEKVIFMLDKGKEGSDILKAKNIRIYDLDLYQVQVDGEEGIKDVNDLLMRNIDVKKYIEDNIKIVDKSCLVSSNPSDGIGQDGN
jgi:DNA primase